MNLNITELPPHICISCGHKHIHRRTYSDLGHGLKEMSISLECRRCRLIKQKLKDLDEKIFHLQQEKLNNQFSLFCHKLNGGVE